jgi:hypothetical protein
MSSITILFRSDQSDPVIYGSVQSSVCDGRTFCADYGTRCMCWVAFVFFFPEFLHTIQRSKLAQPSQPYDDASLVRLWNAATSESCLVLCGDRQRGTGQAMDKGCSGDEMRAPWVLFRCLYSVNGHRIVWSGVIKLHMEQVEKNHALSLLYCLHACIHINIYIMVS